MISNAQKRLGYCEVVYNFNNQSLWALRPGENYTEITDLNTFTIPTDLSAFTNQAGYIKKDMLESMMPLDLRVLPDFEEPPADD